MCDLESQPISMCTPKISIKSLIYGEFHEQKGPKITFQRPEGVISNEEFMSYFVYIFPKKEYLLYNRLVTINTGNYKLLGCPMYIWNEKKYNRNAFLFNLCFVFDLQSQPQYYEIAVKKLGNYLRQLEIDYEFLSNAENIKELPDLMEEIHYSLNEYGYCSIATRNSNMIHMKVSPCVSDVPVIQDYDVPVISKDFDPMDIGQWDLTTQQVLPYLNGLNHVTMVASEADIEISLVKACVQNLLHYKLVRILSIFQYGNMYATTPRLRELVESETLQKECVEYVARNGCGAPSLRDVFMLYCDLTPGTTIKDLCIRHNVSSLRVDERKLIQFGLIKGWIRRLQKYPVRFPSSPSRDLESWFNGQHSYDEISCKTGLSNYDLDSIIDSDSTAVSLWK